MSDNEEIKVEEEGQEEEGQTFFEEIEVAGNNLVREVERLIQEGNVRKLIIKRDDEILLQVNLTLGLASAGAIALFAGAPAVILAAIAALAAAVAKVTVVIEREGVKNEEASEKEDEE